jgi:proton-translocating NAD(P)+ transhydrogenase subunit beta
VLEALPVASILQDRSWIAAWYIVAFCLFIFGLGLVSRPTTARQGNVVAAAGMLIAFLVTLGLPEVGNWGWVALGIVVGTAVGIPAALRVKMTAMPQMVALFNGVGGGAVALIAWVEFRESGGDLPFRVELFSLFSAIIGSISFWGSLIAFGKLQELIPGRPIKVSGQAVINGGVIAAAVALAVVLLAGSDSQLVFVLMLVAAAIAGNLLVLPIGGADMPVVISGLNAFTGLSAAGTGIALGNTALIVAGTLVGASGSILTNLMAKAMNRSIPAIAAGGFGGGVAAKAEEHEERPVNRTDPQDAALQLSNADRVMVVPGYGLAVAQAQRAVADLANALEEHGVEVDYAIHPVAGRMPGHMNVLLAEVEVPYDKLKEMESANAEFEETDISLIIGANDVTNPAARDDEGSPIYGMPILEVDKSERVIIIKRSLSPGFAGIDNELFYNENTQMLFGDAKQSVDEIHKELEAM